MADCILQQDADKFIKAFESGQVNINEWAKLDSAERAKRISFYFKGDKQLVKEINADFESKLLLKNQVKGLTNWVEGMKKVTPKAKDALISKINALEGALNPKESDVFLRDLIEQRLDIGVSPEDALELHRLNTEMVKHKPFSEERAELREQIDEFMEERTKRTDSAFRVALEGVQFITRAPLTTLEFSAVLRQGFRYAGTVPWFKSIAKIPHYVLNPTKPFRELRKAMRKDVHGEKIMANARPLGLTGFGKNMEAQDEDVGSRFVQKLFSEKFFGKKAAKFANAANPIAMFGRAYEGFLNELRYMRMSQILTKWKKAGDPRYDNPQHVKELAEQISINSGRGQLGNFENAAGDIATVAFAARFFASQVQGYTRVVTGGKGGRQEAAMGIVLHARNMTIALSMAVAMGARVEDDLTSSDYGKVCWGNTCIDITGGHAGLLVLINRLVRSESKSSRERIVRNLSGRQKGEAIARFFGNKKAPVVNAFNDFLIRNQDFDRKEISIDSTWDRKVEYVLENVLQPIIVDGIRDAEKFDKGNPDAMPAWAISMLAESVGFGTSSFERKPKPTGTPIDEFVKFFKPVDSSLGEPKPRKAKKFKRRRLKVQ